MMPVVPVWAAEQTAMLGNASLGTAILSYAQNLKENGDGTYTFSIKLNSAYAMTDENTNSAVSKNGYFTAARSGAYLVELWGGNGAAGQSTSYNAG
ncbi:MAG: hypothetical protein IJC68_04180, partial [Firmicutes bacterium]|nr:hypothetical protein [Bacillota bacterium]